MSTQTVLYIVVFLAVAGLVLGIGLWVTRDDRLDKRLSRMGEDSVPLDTKAEKAGANWHATVTKVAAPMAWLSTPKEGWETSDFRVRFMQAGLRGPGWPVILFGAKTFLTLLLPGLLILVNSVSAGSAPVRLTLFVLLLLAAIGYYIPNVVLLMMTRSRKLELQEALPDAIDLMTVCVEAGLGLDAALVRAGSEMALRSQALAEELKLVELEMRVGSTRDAALRSLALRTGVEDIATFVSVIQQSAHFGTNVADSLRTLSDTMRDHRQIRAEEAAAKIPVKMLFPLVFFIFPSLFVVLLGPAMIKIFRILLPVLSGSGG